VGVLALITEIVDWAGPAFQGALGYTIIAAVVLMERALFLSVLVPGDLVLALGGVYAGRGELDLTAVILLGAVPGLISESVGFWLGDRYGAGLIERIPLVRRSADKLPRVRRYFAEHGGRIVVIGRYATVAGTFVPFVAGMGRMPYGRFLLFDVPAVALWAAGVSLIGYILGRNLELVDRVISSFGWLMLGVLAVFLGFMWWRRRRRRWRV
jgi:membrane-associated protein